MIPDRRGTAPPHAPRAGSGEVAADRGPPRPTVRSPLRLHTAAQPRLDTAHRRPPCWRTNTTRHQPSTAWPRGWRSRIDRAVSSAWSRSCSNRARSAAGKAARTSSTRSGSSGPIAGSAPLTPWSSPSRPVLRSGGDSACSGGPTCPTWPPHGDSAGIRPTPYLNDWHDPPHGKADAAPMVHCCPRTMTGRALAASGSTARGPASRPPTAPANAPAPAAAQEAPTASGPAPEAAAT